MEIEQKLALSENPVAFLTEGTFLKLYNQSFYVVNQLLGFKLKPIVKHIKKIDQIIVYGGFPASVINKRYPSATPTIHGYELISDYDLSGYTNWYQQQCQLIQNRPHQPHQGIQKLANNESVTSPLMDIFNPLKPISETVFEYASKTLTTQHLLFLSSWQANKYPPIVDSAFIQELKNHFGLQGQ